MPAPSAMPARVICRPFLWRSETRVVELLKATSPPIGIFGQVGEVSNTLTINKGDTIVFYTDGITEAQAPNGDFFGLNRLFYIIQSRASEPPDPAAIYSSRNCRLPAGLVKPG